MIAEPSNLPLKRWSLADYHRLINAGILSPAERVELLDGHIVEMVPQDPPHASTTDESSDYLKVLFAGRAKVRAQLPITIAPNSEPEPDLAVVRVDANRYRDRHPYPADVFLLIEIANTSLSHDRNRKARIYAQAGIIEYWILDLNQRQVLVYRQPEGERYQVEQVLAASETIAPLAFPEVVMVVANLLS